MPSEEHGRRTTQPEITFGPSAAETIIKEFGWTTDTAGYIEYQSTGKAVHATDGKPIQLENLGGIVKDENGDPTPLRDDFNSIVEHVKRRKEDAE